MGGCHQTAGFGISDICTVNKRFFDREGYRYLETQKAVA